MGRLLLLFVPPTERRRNGDLYEIRLFLGCDIGKGRGGIGFTGANSGCTERKNYQNFSANCNNTHPFLCHSLRTAHRIQKTCVLFFSVLPLLLFRVRIHPLPEDISNSLRRALADATPSLTALNLYSVIFGTGVGRLRSKTSLTSNRSLRWSPPTPLSGRS